MSGCHGNHAITHRPNEFIFEYIRILDSVDPNGHFGTHEKKSRVGGCTIDLAGPQSNMFDIYLSGFSSLLLHNRNNITYNTIVSLAIDQAS